ncbi:MAG: hypothetical protein AB1492_09640, partial [Bacillota bacterium]
MPARTGGGCRADKGEQGEARQNPSQEVGVGGATGQYVQSPPEGFVVAEVDGKQSPREAVEQGEHEPGKGQVGSESRAQRARIGGKSGSRGWHTLLQAGSKRLTGQPP